MSQFCVLKCEEKWCVARPDPAPPTTPNSGSA
jgi:hypothetical protein